ncbi:MAG TPA: helix-turn-helix transcriptional regulator [Bacteroidales bacterium]|nr:helix-turn-helix transcriptional regulator [Bacteroidales bacterium]
MIDRVQKVIQQKKLSASGFADLIGVPRSTISHILSGRNNPSLEFLQKVLDAFPDVQTEWLIRGKGNMMASESTLFSDGGMAAQSVAEIKEASHKVPEPMLKGSSRSTHSTLPFPESVESVVDEDSRVKTPLRKDILEGKPGVVLPEITESTGKPSKKNQKSSKEIYRVLFFYSDGTFSEFSPVNQD